MHLPGKRYNVLTSMLVSGFHPARSSTKPQELADFSIQELRIRRVAPTTRCMTPKRRNRFEGHASMNAASYRPSLTGKWRSVSDGM